MFFKKNMSDLSIVKSRQRDALRAFRFFKFFAPPIFPHFQQRETCFSYRVYDYYRNRAIDEERLFMLKNLECHVPKVLATLVMEYVWKIF
jgi:hypothetical protein